MLHERVDTGMNSDQQVMLLSQDFGHCSYFSEIAPLSFSLSSPFPTPSWLPSYLTTPVRSVFPDRMPRNHLCSSTCGL